MSILQRFLDRFWPVVTIYAHEGEIVFQRGAEGASAAPLIRFADNGKISDIGEEAATAKGGRLVRLFGGDTQTDESALRAFCRYHLQLTQGASLLRPQVIIMEPTFRNAFGPQSAAVMEKVLRADGYKAEIEGIPR